MNDVFAGKTELTDEQLCRMASQGDQNAEEELVIRYMRLARACARPYFLAGGDSEDLLQEAMFGLMKAMREFDESRDASFQTFAVVCIRNRIRSAITAASRDKHAPLNNSVSMETRLLLSEEAVDGPEEELISREEDAERLAVLKEKLSSFEQQILALYLKGFSYREIGRQIGRTDKSVDNAVQRIRRKIAPVI